MTTIDIDRNNTVREARTAEVTTPVEAQPETPVTPPKKDPRLAALKRFAISISVFNIAGHLVLGFEQPPITPILCLLLAYGMEIGLEMLDATVTGRPRRFENNFRSVVVFLLPAHITALACGMLLYSGPVLWPYLLATASGIVVKYIIKAPLAGRMRHVMNPSNFGIALVLLMFPWVGIAPPYMFTANVAQPFDWVIPFAILFLGSMLNFKLTKKYPLILAWVGGFVLQAVVRAVVFDAALLPAIAPLTGVAFILFTNYMITDPGSTPVGRREQIIFGLTCAATYGVLVSLHIAYGLFFALVITCLLRAAVLWAAALRERLSEPALRSEGVVA